MSYAFFQRTTDFFLHLLMSSSSFPAKLNAYTQKAVKTPFEMVCIHAQTKSTGLKVEYKQTYLRVYHVIVGVLRSYNMASPHLAHNPQYNDKHK